jgi:hypothetical protein
MNVKVGDIVRITEPKGVFIGYKELIDKYIEKDVPVYDDADNYQTELKDKVGQVLSIVPHLETELPIAFVYIQEIDKVVLIDVSGGYMSMVQQANTLTEEVLKSKIVSEQYAKMGQKTTICLLTMDNGFEIVGHEACVDPNNFDYEIGKKYAYENAFNKLWQLEGYLLQSNLK